MGKANLATIEPKQWEFAESVKVSRKHLNALQKSNLELVRELHIARSKLSNPGYRSDLTSGQLSRGLQTWESYCEEVGLVKRTADRWLSLFDPEADRLLTIEEFKARKIVEFESLIKELEASVGKPIDWRPDGWSTACENYYRDKLKGQKLLEIAQRDRFEQAELFGQEYLASLSNHFDVASPEEILEFGRLCEDLKPYAVKAVPVQKQARVVKLVEAALAEFQPAVRGEVAKFLAETIVRREVR